MSASDHHGELGHIVPFAVYRNVFIALFILTITTVVTAKYVDLGVGNIIVAMLIASIKALIVALFFMHLKFENPLTWVYAVFPLALLVLMMAGIFIDNPLRMKVEPVHVVDTLHQADVSAPQQ